MAANAEKLISSQEETFEKIKQLCSNYKKDSNTRKTLEYLTKRLELLESLWLEFQANDQLLNEIKDKNMNYFLEGVFTRTKSLYEETKLDMLRRKEELLSKSTASPMIQKVYGKFDFPETSSQTSGNNDSNSSRLQELLYKQNCNFQAFQRAISKINLTKLTEKWELEDTLSILKEKWGNIDKIHLELDYTLQGSNESYEETYTRLESLYDNLKKQISVKIWNNTHCEKAIPTIAIPDFYGNYNQWVSFKDLFTETIHTNRMISKTQKMQHLKSKVKGEAEKLIQHLTISAENYDSCWDILSHRYDNQRLLFTSYMNTLLTHPTVQQANAQNIKKLHDVTLECLNGLTNIGLDISTWDPIIVHLLVQKLDSNTYSEYIKDLKSPRDVPDLEEFLKFLESKFMAFEALRGGQTQKQLTISQSSNNIYKNNNEAKSSNFKSFKNTKGCYTATRNCPMCKTDHVLMQCSKFLNMSDVMRRSTISKLQLCKNCLFSHGDKQCTSTKRCKLCNKAHHTLLHVDETLTSGSGQLKNHQESPQRAVHNVTHGEKEVLLSTIQLRVKAADENFITLRALLDQGSQVNLVTENAAQRLRLSRQKVSAVISGVGTLSGNCKGALQLECKSIHSEYTFNVEALIMKKLINNLPSSSFTIENWNYLENLKLADLNFNTSGPIDMLLGAQTYAELILDGVIRSDNCYPIAQQTRLGWILCGNIKTFNCFVTINELENITRFWEIEDITGDVTPTDEEAICEKHYISTTSRQADGRYIVKMPMKPDFEKLLGKTKPQAISQFLQLEKRMAKNADFSAQYKDFMKEYQILGHMKPVVTSSASQVQAFLPHHGVMKEDSTTTKLRVVFNGSMKTDTKFSINDLMHTGPNLQKDMLTLILHSRLHRYFIKADIEKMFRNIGLDEDQQSLQKIIWREYPNETMQEMQLCTVTYGTKAAPYLAMRTLQQLAQDDGYLYPEAAKVLRNFFYTDDLVHSHDNIQSAQQLIQDLIALTKRGGFNLRKWASNEPLILKDLTEQQKCSTNIFNFKQERSEDMKTLGLSWNPKDDTFIFNWSLPNNNKQPTKRTLLSDISKLYDPLGWLSPATVKAKLLFQKLWNTKMGWDETLPSSIMAEWDKLRKDLPNINKCSLSRWIGYTGKMMELHCFCDASEKAYACVIYSRINQGSDEFIVTLIAAKTKIAPLNKKLTLPRMELQGALLLTKLLHKIKTTYIDIILNIDCWTDSKVVLAWIQGNTNRWESYVANRVTQITTVAPANQWNYVKSGENAADCATRGLFPSQLQTFDLWWDGPSWLRTLEKTKQSQQTFTTEDGTLKNCCITKTDNDCGLILTLLNRYSSMTRVIRVVSWILRFIFKLRNRNVHNNTLSLKELNYATELIIKEVQQQHFHQELYHLKTGKLHSDSSILKLTPFLDEKGLLRVGGRLENSTLRDETKHPVILPHNSKLTELIITQAHLNTLHGGARLTLAQIRLKFWIISGNRAVKKQLRLCVKCHRFKTHKPEQIMANLPKERVTPSRPFTNTGIDFTGHVEVKINKGRGVRTCKGYIAIFICMVTKAVHIELCSDLSTSTFLAAFKRMCARRGTPKHVFTDNGTNFVGAARSLKEDFKHYRTFLNAEFQDELNQLKVEWHFNAPLWPTAGGLWEAAVKSMKYHLKRVLGEQKLTYEQFTTLLTEIEACMNSRPLSPLTEDIDDLEYLTPGHFLIGGPLISLPQKEDDNFNKLDLRNRWRLTEQMNLHIWKRWSLDYLHQLQVRSKWQRPTKDLEKGNLVLVKETNLPPGKWALGRVLDIHPGSDGHVRVVTLKTQKGELKRPITKLSPLPILDNRPATTNDYKQLEIQSQPQSSHKAEKYRTRKKTNFNFFTILLTLFMFFFGTTYSEPTTNFKLIPIQKDHPLYFDKLGNMQFIHDEWTLLVYYNLTTYWQAIHNIKDYVTSLETICQRMTHQPCETITQQLRHDLRHLMDGNELLLSQHLPRRKRGYINGIGNMARTLFGVLDNKFAQKYEQDIAKLQSDDIYLLDLLKNQTSIVEAENNLIKKHTSFMTKEFQHMHNYIKEISSDVTKIEHRVQTLITMNDVNSAAVIASLTINNLRRIQDMILNTLSNTYRGHMDTHLLSTSQLIQQLHIISGSLTSGLSLPINNLHEDLQDMYELLYVKARVTNNFFLSELHIPLTRDEEYTIYHVIPIPFMREGNLKMVKQASSHIAINLIKKSYISFNEEDIQRCTIYGNNNRICRARQPVYTLLSKNAPCEAQLFSQQNTISCRAHDVRCKDDWIKLQNKNTWLYISCERYLVYILCNSQVTSTTLYGAGLISLRQGCILQKDDAKIYTYNHFHNEIYLEDEFMDASFLNSSINNMAHINWNNSHVNITNLETSINTGDIARIEKQLVSQKEHENLPKQKLTSEMSTHDIYQYAISTCLAGGALLGLLYIAARRWKAKTTKTSAKPRQGTSEEIGTELQEITDSRPQIQSEELKRTGFSFD